VSQIKTKDPSPPTDVTKPETTSQAEITDTIRLDNWTAEVRSRIWNHTSGPKVDLWERLSAMQWELGKVKMDGTHFQGYHYHSIQTIENNVNRLSAIYRVRIKTSHVSSIVLEGGVRLVLAFDAYCWETDQHETWTWEDDGEDLTKAGSYAQKYGLMKNFHIGDGQDPDAEAERGKPRRTDRPSASQARTPTPRNGGGAPVDSKLKDTLYELARTLPPTAGWGFKDSGENIKIDAMLKSKIDPTNILTMLVTAHKAAHGEGCEHLGVALLGTEPVEDKSEGSLK
jgi:hypothetical protein